MKAMYIDAPGQVSIKDVEMPVRKEGEVLLKILYGGICGSDLGSYRGTFAYFDYPRIPIEPFCISYHGVSRANVKEGDKVLVVGAGTIGVLAAIAAKAKGATVYISDVSAGKLEMAKDFGVDGTLLNDSPENFEKGVAEITNGNGFDVTIEAVGLPSTFQNCIDACCFGGRMVLIGVGKKNLDFNFTLIQKKELNVFGSRNALKKDFLELIDIVNAGKAPLHKIITNTYAFDDAAKAFDDFAHNPGNMLKVVFDFSKISK